MIIGARSIPRVIDESFCKVSEDSYFTEVGDYKIHSEALMPMIEFEQANEMNESIDKSIFINGSKHKLNVKSSCKVQNYLTTKYIGRAPLKFYGSPTKMGEQFILICRDNNPSYNTRYFGTEDAIHGFNRSANDSHYLPRKY